MSATRSGFTLMELMITIAILAILVAIATPYYLNYAKESRKNACIANLKKIEGAVSMAKTSGIANPAESDLFGLPGGQLKTMPHCPNNNAPYTQFDPPACPAGDPDHVMPPR